MPDTPTFETPRLLAKEWHSLGPGDWDPQDLQAVVCSMLTERVTAPLPSSWQGAYTLERAGRWIEERDREGTTLLVVNKADQEPVGLVLYVESDTQEGRDLHVRLGYLVAEAAWGRGFGTEIVRGFVDWCEQRSIASITGGVERGNTASVRVLEKNGFVRVPTEEAQADEDMFVLQLGARY